VDEAPFLDPSVLEYLLRFGIFPPEEGYKNYYGNIVSLSEHEHGEYPFEAVEEAEERYWSELWVNGKTFRCSDFRVITLESCFKS
jgi:hypothetical protein